MEAKPYVYFRPYENDISPESAVAMLWLQQLVADSYTDARRIWDKHRDMPHGKDMNPLFYPSKKQQDIEKYLIEKAFIAKPTLATPKPKPARIDIAPEERSRPTPSSRWRKCMHAIASIPRKRKRSNGSSIGSSRSVLSPTRLWHSVRRRSDSTAMSISPPSTPKSSSIMIPPANTKFNQSDAEAPFDHPLITDSQLSSSVESIPLLYSRFLPPTSPKQLRRMSWPDRQKLITSCPPSRRRRRATAPPQPVTNMHIPKGLLTPKSMPHLMFEDPATLPWPSKPPVPPKPRPRPIETPTPETATTTPSIPWTDYIWLLCIWNALVFSVVVFILYALVKKLMEVCTHLCYASRER